MGELRGKVIVVTGASRGIGRALALRFAEEGATVALAAKTVDPNPRLPGSLGEVREEILARGGRVSVHAVDVRDERAVASLFEDVAQHHGGTDILVNNAGALFWAPITQTPAKRFDLVVGVNARAAFLCAHHAVPQMLGRGGGHVINMAPPISTDCTKNRTAYMISKFGMTLVAEGIAAEHGRDGIKAHALWPVTMVESHAVIGNHLGDPTLWRKPEIIVDATMALLTGRADVANGAAVYDEDVLARVGITDFSGYACVPGTTPPPARLDDSASYWRQ
jgi:citronellol/citronellal dehydrogenase